MPKDIKFKFIVLVFLFFSISCATTFQDSQYREALVEAKAGNLDLAFMRLSNYLRECPNSIYEKQIKFAIGEYYLETNNYREAIYKLSGYIQDYPDDKSVIFAQALLYKAISEYNKEPELITKIKENFFSKSLFLLFSDSKVKYYKSILNNAYKIEDHLDRIEIVKDNGLFIKITP